MKTDKYRLYNEVEVSTGCTQPRAIGLRLRLYPLETDTELYSQLVATMASGF